MSKCTVRVLGKQGVSGGRGFEIEVYAEMGVSEEEIVSLGKMAVNANYRIGRYNEEKAKEAEENTLQKTH